MCTEAEHQIVWSSFVISKLTSWTWALLEKPPVVQLLKNLEHFMEPEGSLPFTQEPSTSPYPEPDQSSRYQLVLISILILSTHPRLDLPSGLFPSATPTNILYAFISIRATCPAHYPPWLDHPDCTWRKSISYEAHYADFFNLLSLHLTSVQIVSSAPCSQTPLVYVPDVLFSPGTCLCNSPQRFTARHDTFPPLSMI
jgi:hypothetical protein